MTMVWMFRDLILTNGIETWELKDRTLYDLPDYWAKQLMALEECAEYVEVKQ